MIQFLIESEHGLLMSRKIINELNYEYPERKRMFAKDPRTRNIV